MKEIPNSRLDSTETVASLLKLALQYIPPNQGLSFTDIRNRLRIEKALEGMQEGVLIKLEDTDYDNAVAIVKEVRWTTTKKCLVAFAEVFGL